jgi:chloramphenicol 3-O-phosphotransferase
MARVIILTGPSCAGKTSLAQALQSLLPFPAVHIEADLMFPTLKNAGAGFVVGVTTGSFTRAQLEAEPHTRILDSVATLPALL